MRPHLLALKPAWWLLRSSKPLSGSPTYYRPPPAFSRSNTRCSASIARFSAALELVAISSIAARTVLNKASRSDNDTVEGGCQRRIVGRDARMRCEKSGAPSAACAASLIRERRRSSSNGSVVSNRPDS
jgi:hypothetical protein